jgi:hypothetical protein
LVFCSTTLAGPPAGSGVEVRVVSMISRSGQSTPVTLEQKSSWRRGSSRRNAAIARAWKRD